MRAVAFLIAALCSCAIVAGCGSSETASVVVGDPITARELAASGTTSAEARSGRFAFEVSATYPGADEPFSLSGEGAFDAVGKRASFAVDLSSLARILGDLVAGLGAPSSDLPDFDDPSGWKIDVVQDGDVEYVRLPAMDAQLPDGKQWVRASKASSKDRFDFGALQDAAETDPRQVLDALASVSGEVETVGTEELHGVDTTHYRAKVDPVALAKAEDAEGRRAQRSLVDQLTAPGVEEFPVDVWIDGEGFVRKLSMELSTESTSSSHGGGAAMTFELWDYGRPVGIDLPPDDEIVDASALHS